MRLNNIADMLGKGVDEVAKSISTPLQAIRNYTNKLYLSRTYQSGKFEIVNGILTGTNFKEKFKDYDIIELYNSEDNTQIYVIKTVTDTTIEVYGGLLDEKFTGYILKLRFNIPESIVVDMMNYNTRASSKIGVRSESLDGYSYTLTTDPKELVGGYPASLMNQLPRQMPGQESREYRNAGIPIRQPLYR